jgi:RNA polymerase sigma-70 factor, ECF subfamily
VKDDFVPHVESTENSVASSVIDRAKRGDQEAFKQITVLYAGLVYHWCRTTGLSAEDTEDVGQQVFLTVSKNLHGFSRKKPGDSFRAWLRVITRSRIVDHIRENANREKAVGGTKKWNEPASLSFLEDESDEERNLAKSMIYEKAMSLIQGAFSAQDCRALHLVVVEGMSPKEVAEQLGIEINSVYIAKSRILKWLRNVFGELLDDEEV